MKRFVSFRFVTTGAVVLAAFSSSAFAQLNTSTVATSANATTTYTVQLTALPAGQIAFGNPVTLTARVRAVPPITTPGVTLDPASHLRFTFKARMTSPCAGMNPITIATNAGPVATWNPPKGGNYNITVNAVPDNTLPHRPPDATLSYIVTGGPATPDLPFASIISTPVVPSSGGGTAPVNATITLNMNAPPYSAIYSLSAGCETAAGSYLPCTGTGTNNYATLPVTFPPLHLAASGQYLLYVSGVMIRQSDCQAMALVYTHTNPYTVH